MLKLKGSLIFALIFTLLLSNFSSVTPVNAAASNNTVIPLSFTPKDSIVHPTKPIIYLTSPSEKKLYAINYETLDTQSLSFELSPEALALDQGELFITFSTLNHASGSTGKIVTVNTETFQPSGEHPIDVDPYNIAVRKDLIYIRHSVGWYSYSKSTFNRLTPNSNVTPGPAGYGFSTDFILHPYVERLYYIHEYRIPVARDVDPYLGLEGNPLVYAENKSRSYDPNHLMISADGQYLFDNGGAVYDPDLKEISNLGYAINEMTSNPESKDLYIAPAKEKQIRIIAYAYDPNTGFRRFNEYAVRETLGSISQLHYQNNKVLAVTKTETSANQIEVLSVPASREAEPNLALSPFIPINFTPADTVFHPTQPIVYLTSEFENRVYALNYQTKTTSFLTFDQRVEKLAFANDTLYVSHPTRRVLSGYSDASSPGAVSIIDTKTFTTIDTLQLEENPRDIAASEDGIIYVVGQTSPAGISSYSVATKQRISSLQSKTDSYSLEYNPHNQSIYVVAYQAYSAYSVDKGIFGTRTAFQRSIVNTTFSPDGRFVFGGSEFYDGNSTQLGSLEYAYKNLAFDTEHLKMFVQREDRSVQVYDYAALLNSNTLKKVGQLRNLDIMKDLYYQNNQLVTLTQSTDLNDFSNQHYLEFYTFNPEDPFSISAVYPGDHSESALISDRMGFTFSDFIVESSNLAGITLKDSSNTPIPITANVSDIYLVIEPQSKLKFNEAYTLTLPSDAVEGYAGQKIAAPYTLSFKTDHEFVRLGGTNRYETSSLISAKGWDRSDYAVLAYGEDFADALSAAPLASRYNAPILLTDKEALPPTTDMEIERLGVKKLFIVGGTGVVSPSIENALKARNIEVTRIAGLSRYETAVAVAKHLGRSEEVFLVSGENYPDALSIASYAAAQEIPILLTPKDTLPTSVKEYISQNRVNQVYIIGGTGVVADPITYSLPGRKRIAGRNRYETNFEILKSFGFDSSLVLFAHGESFPDALSGSALAGRGQHPVVLLSEYANQEFIDNLRYNKANMETKYILGGTGVMPMSLIDKVFN